MSSNIRNLLTSLLFFGNINICFCEESYLPLAAGFEYKLSGVGEVDGSYKVIILREVKTPRNSVAVNNGGRLEDTRQCGQINLKPNPLKMRALQNISR